MPLYEYQCESCAKRFERIQKYSDPPIETCPSCGSHVKKLLSSPAIQFKGSGFYITDYPKKSQTEGGKQTDTGKPQTDNSSTKSEGSSTTSDSGASSPATTTSTSDTSTSSKTKKD